MCSASNPLIEVERCAASTLAFYILPELKLIVGFCFFLMWPTSSCSRFARGARTTRIIRERRASKGLDNGKTFDRVLQTGHAPAKYR